MSAIKALTTDYEGWLRQRIPVVDADLAAKHALMDRDVFTFFRGTYYLWLVRVAEQVPEALAASAATIVGDLHAENFGTWHDDSGELRWGVTDLDELARGSWLLDLLRLATSAALSPHIGLKTKDIADLVLDAYAGAAETTSARVAEHPHLSALVPTFKDADGYFHKLGSGEPAAEVPASVLSAAARTVAGPWSPTWHLRQAGVGSLGHRRVVGVGTTASGWAAREAKQLDPGSVEWARAQDTRLPMAAPAAYVEVVRALDAPAACVRADGWQLRALAPDEVRIELSGLAGSDATLVVQSMAAATAVVHGVDRSALAQAQNEATAFDRDRFRDFVKTMKQTIEQDFENSR